MHFHGASFEPAAAALREMNRLDNLGKPEQAGVESPRIGLAPGRHGELHMIETQDRHASSFTPNEA